MFHNHFTYRVMFVISTQYYFVSDMSLKTVDNTYLPVRYVHKCLMSINIWFP
nr:MAG TPA: hypothetical protein [Caudoviricetes sp.]